MHRGSVLSTAATTEEPKLGKLGKGESVTAKLRIKLRVEGRINLQHRK